MQHTASTQPDDMRLSRAWAARFLTGAGQLPISFTLDEQPITGIPDAWNPSAHARRIDANIIETIFEGMDPATGLQLRLSAWNILITRSWSGRPGSPMPGNNRRLCSATSRRWTAHLQARPPYFTTAMGILPARTGTLPRKHRCVKASRLPLPRWAAMPAIMPFRITGSCSRRVV